VERTIDRVHRTDARLGARRPETVAAVLAVLEERLDAARRLRLARDQWALKSPVLDRYRRNMSGPMDDLWKTRDDLDEIRSLAGPPATRLDRLERRLVNAGRRLAIVVPPEEATAAHALATSATQLALQAARLRREAIASGAMPRARDASAAAAGALMLMARARTAVVGVARRPQLR
jgi:hypothetical protein